MTPPKLVTIDASEPVEKINEIIARDGGVIVANFLPKEIMAKSMEDGESCSVLDEDGHFRPSLKTYTRPTNLIHSR